MLLAVNIGNTNLRFAVFKSETEIITWTINSKPYRTEYEFFAKFSNMYEPFGIEKDDITDIVINGEQLNLDIIKKIRNKTFVLERKFVKDEIRRLSKLV